MSLGEMSVYGAVLILVTAVIRMLGKNRLPKTTFLVLWWIALLRLLVPFSISAPVSVYTWAEEWFPAASAGKREFFDVETAISGREPSEDSAGKNTQEKSTFGESLSEKNMFGENSSEKGTSGKNMSGRSALREETADEKGAAAALGGQTSTLKAVNEEAALWEALEAVLFPEAAGGNVPAQGLILWLLWMAGALLEAGYFAAAYFQCYREFRTSLPVENEFAKKWLKAHRLRRPVAIRQLDRISTPLTYGVFCPVILLPKAEDWTQEKLAFVLEHERSISRK